MTQVYNIITFNKKKWYHFCIHRADNNNINL